MNPVERFGYDMTRGKILFKLELNDGSPVITVLDHLSKSQVQYIAETEGLSTWLRRETYEWVTDQDDNFIPGVYLVENIDSSFAYPYTDVIWEFDVRKATDHEIEVGTL